MRSLALQSSSQDNVVVCMYWEGCDREIIVAKQRQNCSVYYNQIKKACAVRQGKKLSLSHIVYNSVTPNLTYYFVFNSVQILYVR